MTFTFQDHSKTQQSREKNKRRKLHLGKMWHRALIFTGLLFALTISAPSALAALITTNEAGLDAVFSQTNFGANTIDIRFNSSITIINASLLDIDTSAELNTLFGLSPSARPGINMFFVDAINWCGSPGGSIVGCASTGGNDLVLNSSTAAGGSGTELAGHEIGHNLGLGHSAGLMNGFLNGDTTLSAAQVAVILADTSATGGLVQSDANGLFIQVTPILISAVPVPAAVYFFGSGLFSLFWMKRRKTA